MKKLVTAEYQAWLRMRQRCRSPSHPAYKDYGARGIQVCDRWDDFDLFLNDVGLKPSQAHTLGRKNNDGDYFPGNVRWETRKQQANNTRRNRLFLHNGRVQTLAQLSEQSGVPYINVHNRLSRGLSIEEALQLGRLPRKDQVLLTIDGITLPAIEWARKSGIKYATVHKRIKCGLSPEQCISKKDYRK